LRKSAKLLIIKTMKELDSDLMQEKDLKNYEEIGDISSISPQLSKLGAPPQVSAILPGHGCPVSDVREKLRRVGLRPTRQRLSLGWLLFGKGDRHITAEMLYEEALRARVPVSLATIYNTLHQFTEVGLLRELMVDGSKAYFDTNPKEHHHFYIEDDQALLDLPADVAQTLQPLVPEGYEIVNVEMLVRLKHKSKSGR